MNLEVVVPIRGIHIVYRYFVLSRNKTVLHCFCITVTMEKGAIEEPIAAKWDVTALKKRSSTFSTNNSRTTFYITFYVGCLFMFREPLYITYYVGCPVMFNKDTFHSNITVKFIYLHNRNGQHQTLREGQSGRVLHRPSSPVRRFRGYHEMASLLPCCRSTSTMYMPRNAESR